MITVKVFPTLRSFLPPKMPGNAEFFVDLSDFGKETGSIEELVTHLGIPVREVHMVILNGQILRNFDRVLEDGDRVVLSPPIAGG